MQTKVKVAAVQASPVFLDLEATVTKSIGLIEEAAANGADLIVFPEGFFPGYPYFIWLGDPGYQLPFYVRWRRNALTVPSEAMSRLSDAARDNNIYVCASGTELDGASLYLTQFWFDRQGNIINKHRKVKPTGVERTMWGDGDGSTMQVVQTEIGRLGGLQCWEHCMVINNLIMSSQTEQIHAASWPAFAWDVNSVHHYSTAEAASQYYAVTTGSYVVLASETLSQDAIDQMCGDDEYKRGIYKAGYACPARILNPDGKIISGELPSHDVETIVYGDIDWDDGTWEMHKYHIDITGHYSRGGVGKVIFDKSQKVPAVIAVGEDADNTMSYEELHGIDEL